MTGPDDETGLPDQRSLLILGALSLVVGVAAGFAGAAYRLCLSAADHWRDVIIAWAQGRALVGFFCVVALCGASAFVAAWLVRRFSPHASGSGIPHVESVLRGETPPSAPFPALAAAVREHSLPLAPFHDLVSAFRQDVTVTRYANFDGVLDYCRRSANPVGRLLLALYGVQAPADLAASDAICTGLQLTNFWQDIAIDWKKDRVYLPQDDLRRFGVTEPQIANGQVDAAWRALLAFEVARARGLLESGRPLTRVLPWRLGLELSAVISGGLRILERIDAVGGDVFTRRPVLATRDWLAVAWRTVAPRKAATA